MLKEVSIGAITSELPDDGRRKIRRLQTLLAEGMNLHPKVFSQVYSAFQHFDRARYCNSHLNGFHFGMKNPANDCRSLLIA